MKPWEEAKIKPWEEAQKAKKGSYEGYARGFLESLPVAGGLIGGVLGTPLGPIGMAAGGGLGAAGGKALENIGESFLGDKKTREEIYTEPLKEGAMGLAAEGAGQVVGKGVGKVADFGKSMVRQFREMPVENTQEIIDAAQRLETKPTTGMLTESKLRQNFEGSIGQSPYDAGEGIRRQYKDIYQKLNKASEDVLEGAIEVSPVKAGSFAKDSMTKSIEQYVKPATEVYENIAKETPNIMTNPASLKRVSDNIRNLPYAKIKGSPEASFAKNIAENLESLGGNKVGNLADLRNLRSYTGQVFNDRNATPTMKRTASEIYQKLSNLEKSTITRQAIKNASTEVDGKNIAKGMINEIRQANKIYAEVNKDIKSLSRKIGLGNVKNYQDFINKIQEIPEEQLYKKIINLNKISAVNDFAKMFPKAYQAARKGKFSEIYQKSMYKGGLSPAKLVTNLKKLTPESKNFLFGNQGVQKIKDIETVTNAIPELFNPSGTAKGMEFMEFNPLTPSSWFSEFNRRVQNYLLQNPDKISELGIRTFPMERSAIRGLISQPATRGLLGDDE